MDVLDEVKNIKRIDRSDMLNLLLEFPLQCRHAFKIGESFSTPASYRGFDNIVFSGLGGSAIGADLIRSYVADDIKIPVFVNRDYTIPNFVGKDTLFLACSYSGDTEETLASYDEAKKRRAKVIAISSGGKLEAAANRDKIPFISIPKGYPPRTALGYAFFPWLAVLSNLGLIRDKRNDVKETLSVLEDSGERLLNPNVKTGRNSAKRLALDLHNKYVIIYSAGRYFDSVITRWRGQFAENSKTLASTHIFPEMNHNETVGWENPKRLLKDFIVVILRDESEHPRVARRIDITRSIIEKRSKVVEIRSKGKRLLSRMFYLVYIGDFVSYYLAILNGVDPTPVEAVTYLKKELSKYR